MAQETSLDPDFAPQDSLQIIDLHKFQAKMSISGSVAIDSWAAAAQVLFLSTIIVQVGRYLVALVATDLKKPTVTTSHR